MKQIKGNLFLQFTIVSLIVSTLIALVIGIYAGMAIRSHARKALADEARAAVSSFLIPRLTPDDLQAPMTGPRYERFDRFIKTAVISDRVARVKLWGKDATIVYSDEPEAVGKRFPDNAELLRALNGETVTEIDLSEEDEVGGEKATERSLGQLMAVYTPVVFPGDTRPQGAFEVYQYYGPTARLIAGLRYRASLSIGMGFFVLYSVLVGMAWRGWRAIKRQQEALVASDRLASIGELVSGAAHELNNPLTSVIGFSQLLLQKDISGDVRDDVQVIHDEAQRTGRIVQNLLAFARQQAPVKQRLNANTIIERVLTLRDYEQKVNNIRTAVRLDPGLPDVIADPAQLQQVIFNLVINAEYFMSGAHKGGTLTVTTENTGKSVRVSIADDGPGIPAKNMRRLFTPFFTTKEIGRGTGLGLSVCYGIITQHGGTIRARSEPGKGATFIITLPAAP